MKRRKLECEEEVNGMLGVGKKSGLVRCSMFNVEVSTNS